MKTSTRVILEQDFQAKTTLIEMANKEGHGYAARLVMKAGNVVDTTCPTYMYMLACMMYTKSVYMIRAIWNEQTASKEWAMYYDGGDHLWMNPDTLEILP